MDALLERGRGVAPVPDDVRARVLARANGALTRATAAPSPLPPPRRRRLPLALAASLALGIATASAIAAFRPPRDDGPASAPTSRARPQVPSRVGVLIPLPPDPAAALDRQPTERERGAPPRAARASQAAELELLHRAQAAHAARSFADALRLVDAHARRFPAGRLVEEREALRVRALAGAGRADEAQAAAAEFTRRFPRSVFLPRLGVSPGR
jgi:hypothetical protein